MKCLKDGTVRLSQAEHSALVEALRRRSRFRNDPTGGAGITEQWTGLGSEATYKAAKTADLMEIATTPTPGFDTWWRLTQRGAFVVYWICLGFDHEKVERGDLPPATFPALIL